MQTRQIEVACLIKLVFIGVGVLVHSNQRVLLRQPSDDLSLTAPQGSDDFGHLY